MDTFDRALSDPQSVYTYPKNVVNDSSLTKEQKLQILKQWEHDARLMEIADEENMGGGDSPSMLSRVSRAIQELSR